MQSHKVSPSCLQLCPLNPQHITYLWIHSTLDILPICAREKVLYIEASKEALCLCVLHFISNMFLCKGLFKNPTPYTLYRKDIENVYHAFMYSPVTSFRYLSITCNAFIACYIRHYKYGRGYKPLIQVRGSHSQRVRLQGVES